MATNISGTIDIEASADGVNFCAVASLKSSNDNQVIVVASSHMRVVATNSSASSVIVMAEQSLVRSAVIPPPPVNGPGGSIDVSSFGSNTTVYIQKGAGGSIELQISADGQRMVLAYASQENNKDFEVPHPTLARATAGTWTEATGLETSLDPLAFTATGLAALDQANDVLSIIPDIGQPATAQPVPMWPARGTALVTDGSTLLPVIQVGERVWAPLPPQ